MKHWYCFLLVLFFSVSTACGQSDDAARQELLTIYDFRNDWLIYSKNYQNYIPYTPQLHSEEPSVSLKFDLLKNRKYLLLLQTDRTSHLFINGALAFRIEPQKPRLVNLDSLYAVYKRNDILLTLYGSNGITGKTAQLVISKTRYGTRIAQAVPASVVLKPRTFSFFADVSILILLFVLAGHSLCYSITPISYRSFISVREFISSPNAADRQGKPLEYSGFLFVVIYCFTAGWFYLTLATKNPWLEKFGFTTDQENLPGLLLTYLKILFLVLAALFLKVTVMYILSLVLNLRKLVSLHYMKILQSSVLYFGLVSAFLFIVGLQSPELYQQLTDFMLPATAAFFALRAVFLYFGLIKKGSLINLYLFSYLCVTEIIPILFILKIDS